MFNSEDVEIIECREVTVGDVSQLFCFLPDCGKAEAGPRSLPGDVEQNEREETPKCFLLTWGNAI